MLNKANVVDLSAVAVILLVIAIGAIYYLRAPVTEKTKLKVVVEVNDTSQARTIREAANSSKVVYLNSIDNPVEGVGATMAGESLQIALLGPGHVDDKGFYIFNGQRLLIGQKAEIHASYFAQGKIVKIENAE